MKNKTARFVQDVHCQDDYASAPGKATIVLDEAAAKRILKLSKAAKRLGVYKIVDWDGTPTYHGKDGDTGEAWRLECATLNVTDDDFLYDAILKHTNIVIETESIRIEDLLKKFPQLKGAR